MANPEPRVTILKRLVAAARSVVTYEVGQPVGCIRIGRLLFVYQFNTHESLPYPVFDAYLKETQLLPIASDRLWWNRQALAERDEILEVINQRYRDPVFASCFDIIDRFGATDGKPAWPRRAT